MAENAPVNLNEAWMKTFLEDVRTFAKEITAIQAEAGGVPSLNNLSLTGERPADLVLSGTLPPLTVGGMATESKETNGKHLYDSVLKMVDSVIKIYEEQELLFKSIDENLETTIAELLDAQGASLEKIEGQKLLDIFSDVEEVLDGGSGEDDE